MHKCTIMHLLLSHENFTTPSTGTLPYRSENIFRFLVLVNCHILRSKYKKDEESATDCDVLMHHPLNTPYWDWAESLNLKHLRPLQFSDLTNVETTLLEVAWSQQINNNLECKITLRCW
jgi:hypothetical protein